MEVSDKVGFHTLARVRRRTLAAIGPGIERGSHSPDSELESGRRSVQSVRCFSRSTSAACVSATKNGCAFRFFSTAAHAARSTGSARAYSRVAMRGPEPNAQRFGRFLFGHAAEESAFDYLGLAGIERTPGPNEPRGWRLHDAAGYQGGCFASPPGVKLLQNVVDVILHGGDFDAQPPGDVLVGAPLVDQDHDLPLP